MDGCVTHILHLTITPSSTEEYTEAACDEFTWSIDGETYTESGDYNSPRRWLRYTYPAFDHYSKQH
ncbi:hypothetical protein MASR1M74_02660 [Lentimicrobium sp.]